MKKEIKTKMVSLRITPAELLQLDRLCENANVTRSWLLRNFILNSYKKLSNGQLPDNACKPNYEL